VSGSIFPGANFGGLSPYKAKETLALNGTPASGR
ncbi:hypothetical protein L195_g001351, partial [Trifolium pratense]